MLRTIIKQELEKLSNLTNIESPQSFVFFNSDNEVELKIRKVIIDEFNKVKTCLNEQRNSEIKQLLEKLSWVNEKYSDLLDRYSNFSIKQDICKWANDAQEHEYNFIISQPTKLKEKTDNLNLRQLHLTQYFQSIKEFHEMNDTMDFTNLLRCQEDESFKKYYKYTDKETKYEELRHNIYNYSKYLYCYGIELQTELYNFETLFYSIFKWDSLYWSVFNLSMSKTDFENQAGDFLKTELYYNRILIDAKDFQVIEK